MNKIKYLEMLEESIEDLEIVIQSGIMDSESRIYKARNILKNLFNTIQKDGAKMELTQDVYSEMVVKCIELKALNPSLSADKIASEVLNEYKVYLNLSENKEADILFQLTYSLVNEQR